MPEDSNTVHFSTGASHEPNALTDRTCPNCQNEMVAGTSDEIRLDLAGVVQGFMTSSEGEERLQADLTVQHCLSCGYTRGSVTAYGYAGY